MRKGTPIGINYYGTKDYAPGCVEYLPAKDLNVGDKVVCLISRLSSGSAWLKNTSQYHGWYECPGIISSIRDNGMRKVTLDEERVLELKTLCGKEQYESHIGGVGNHVDHIIKIGRKEL